MKNFIKDSLLFKGDFDDRILGLLTWVSIGGIIVTTAFLSMLINQLR